MKTINPLFRKVLIDIKELDFPLEAWLSDSDICGLKFNLASISPEKSIRIPNTPDSIIEFSKSNFIRMEETSEIDLLLPGSSLHLTQFHKFWEHLQFPIPKSTFNDEFEFPITLICLLSKSDQKPIKLDISNYSNLDYLIDRQITILDHLANPKEYSPKNFNPDSFLFAEYLKLG